MRELLLHLIQAASGYVKSRIFQQDCNPGPQLILSINDWHEHRIIINIRSTDQLKLIGFYTARDNSLLKVTLESKAGTRLAG